MQLPKWKKKLKFLLSSIERFANTSKTVALSTGLLTLAPGQTGAQVKVPVAELTLPKTEISKYSSKFLLKSSTTSKFSAQFAQHRSHSSHSSHRSHSSHSSHFSSSSPSHYSSSGTTAPPPPKAPTAPKPELRTINFGEYVVNNRHNRTKWSRGTRTNSSSVLDEHVEVHAQGTQLTVTPRASVPGSHYNGYVTDGHWDLTSGQAVVEVVQAASQASTIFALVVDDNNWYRFVAENGTLYFESKVSGVLSSAKIAYSPSDHRFWRFRHDASNNLMLWETSSNEAKWTVRHAITPQIPITALYVELNAGTNKIVSTPGSATFDNFRIVLDH